MTSPSAKAARDLGDEVETPLSILVREALAFCDFMAGEGICRADTGRGPDDFISEYLEATGAPYGDDTELAMAHAARMVTLALRRPQPAGVSEGDVARAINPVAWLTCEQRGEPPIDEEHGGPWWVEEKEESLVAARRIRALLRAPAQGETWQGIEPDAEQLLCGARAIGRTIDEVNHIQRAREVWQAMRDRDRGSHPGNATPDPGNEARSLPGSEVE